VPVRVSNLANIVSIANTGTTGYAVRNDGTVWSWGDNTAGALGNNSTVSQTTVPVQVSGLTNITKVVGAGSNGHAHRADGTVWSWGNNDAGQLGNGSTAAFSRVPVQVSGLTNITSIAAGRYNGYAVRGDGTVWSWGAGSNGALGSSAIDCADVDFPCARRTPVQVSNLTDVTTVASFEYGAYALRENGTVAAWGFSGSNALGTDTAGEDALVPVAVTGLTGVTAIGAGEYAGYAVTPTS
jgi:alpha-tubulin suppressor-like RCC1 family protein